MKKNQLKKSNLYVILGPDSLRGRSVDNVVDAALRGGADIIQLRCKQSSRDEIRGIARRIEPMIHAHGKLFIVNDYVDLVEPSMADGVHLGQDDMAIEDARNILGSNRIIGKSTHSPEQAMQAEAQAVDYIGYGPIHGTPTKPEYPFIGIGALDAIVDKLTIPFFAIGGIHSENMQPILDKGCSRIAIVRDIILAEDVYAKTKMIKQMIAKGGVCLGNPSAT